MSKYPNILVFDTETTGLIPKYSSDKTNNPYITQLSFIIYNTETNSIRSTFNAYINLPDEVEIPPIVTNITGITKETCQEKGISFQEAFAEFYYAILCSDCIVAHNIEFDIQMMYIEIERNKHLLNHYPEVNTLFHPERLSRIKIDIKCTMRMTVTECALLRTTDKKHTYKKFPKLAETYEYLFQKTPENLHNSIIDVIVCLRCFLKIQFSTDIPEEEYAQWIQANL
jgi:DNA polymerase III epsilon subunit-like protein